MMFLTCVFTLLNVLQHDFFPKLVNLFRTCKDLGDTDGLHMIFRLVKAISKYILTSKHRHRLFQHATDVVSDCAVLLNSSAIFDRILSADLILDIIGVLECKHYTLCLSFVLYIKL